MGQGLDGFMDGNLHGHEVAIARLNFGASTLIRCRRRDPSPAPPAVSSRRGMWDGERPKQSLEDPKAIELAWWGRGAGAFEFRATSRGR